MEDYREGLPVSAEELKYLTMTSPTLFKFLDKEFYKKCVKILDPEFLENVKNELFLR